MHCCIGNSISNMESAKISPTRINSKILVIGNRFVGKSTILVNWISGFEMIKLSKMSVTCEKTMGVAKCKKTLIHDEYEHVIDIVEIGGCELNGNLIPSYTKDISACIICIDINNGFTAMCVYDWVKTIEPHIPIYCVFTKYELLKPFTFYISFIDDRITEDNLPFIHDRITKTFVSSAGTFPSDLATTLATTFETLHEQKSEIGIEIKIDEPLTNLSKILELLSSITPQLNKLGAKIVVDNEIKIKGLNFPDIIQQIHDNFRSTYVENVGSLREIIVLIDSLSDDEKIRYDFKISLLKKTISEYGKDMDKQLTYKQVNKLYGIISSYKKSFTPYSSCIPREINNNVISFNHNQIDDNIVEHDQTDDKSFKQFHDNGFIDYDVALLDDHKLGFDDEMWPVISGFIDNLSRDGLDSSITVFVEDYFMFVGFVLETDIDNKTYAKLTSAITNCLIFHSWRLKSETSAGGFYSKPNREQLVKDMNSLVAKYFG